MFQEMTDQPRSLPEPLRLSSSELLHELNHSEQLDLSQFSEVVLSALPRVFACSDYIARRCVRQPALLDELVTSGDLLLDYQLQDYTDRLTAPGYSK